MRRLPWIILAVLVIAIGGYSVFWYLQAQHAKEVFTEISRRLPETASPDGTKVSLTYDSIDVGGYPFSYRIVYKNPVFSWVKKDAANLKGFAPAAGLQPANTIKINGDLMFESNYLASSLGISLKGSMDGTTPTPEGYMSWQANWEDAAGCQFEISNEARSKLLRGMEVMSLFQSGEDFLNNLREANCKSKANTVKRLPDGKQIFSSPGSDIHLALTPLDDINSRVDLKMQAKDVLFTKEYGMMFAGLSEETVVPQGGGYSQFDERAGKTTVDIDLSATGPFRNQGAMPPAYDLDIQSRAFTIKNNWYEVNLPLSLTLKKTETSGSFNVKHDGTLRFSKEMETALRNDSLTSGRAYQELKELFQNQGRLAPTKEELVGFGVFPELSSFGTIKTFADAATDDTGKALSVQSLGAGSDLYGFNAKGNVSLENGNADVMLTCDHCITMVDDAVSYYNRLQDFLRQINPETQTAVFGAEQTEALKQLLASLDTDAATADQITIQYKRDGDAQTLSGQPLDQVMMQAMLIVAAPPTAAGTAEPSDEKPAAEKPAEKPAE